MYLLKYLYLYTINYLIYHISLSVLAANPLETNDSSHLISIQDLWFASSLCLPSDFTSLTSFSYNLLNRWLSFLAHISISRLKSFVHCDGVLIISEG